MQLRSICPDDLYALAIRWVNPSCKAHLNEAYVTFDEISIALRQRDEVINPTSATNS
jgi:hypothetical protein